VETSTQVEPSREGRKRTREVDRLVQDVRENVGAPSNFHRKRRSPDWHIGYMSIMTKLVENESSSLEEAIKQHVWLDAMFEEYESIVKKSV